MANSYSAIGDECRHGRKFPAPSSLMKKSAANDFMNRLLLKWIDYKSKM